MTSQIYIEISEDDKVQIEDSEGVAKTRSIKENGMLTQLKRINGDVMLIDLSKFQRESSRAR